MSQLQKNNSLNWISQNLLIISEIWLIQIAKKRLLWISQISLIISVTINWFGSKIILFTDDTFTEMLCNNYVKIVSVRWIATYFFDNHTHYSHI